MNLKREALKLHKDNKGKLMVKSKVSVSDEEDLSLAYSPGVAEPCLEIADNEERIFDYTNKSNFVAVISNGSAVLGLGNIGANASLPVMEGKSVLFKEFGGVDAFPICINESDPDMLVDIIKKLAPTFGGFNLEDIKAPECFYIEEKLKEEVDIPVFHDDQHGTAIITLAALMNSLKIVDKNLADIKIIISGAGAAGYSTAKMLIEKGAKNIVVCDSKGSIYSGRSNLNSAKEKLAEVTNINGEKGGLAEVIEGADVFIGVSIPEILSKEMVETMNTKPILFPMANPDPEIWPEEALEAGAKIVGTGRSDYPNQVNNVMAFPGIFRGALDVRAKEINEKMKLAAAHAIAELVSESELSPNYVIPKPFDKRLGPNVAASVAQAAVDSGVARYIINKEEELKKAKKIMNQ